MKALRLGAASLLAITACASDTIPVRRLADGGLVFGVAAAHTAAGDFVFSLQVTKVGETANGPQDASDCTQLSPDTKYTVNGLPGTLYLGEWDDDAGGQCQDPFAMLDLATPPPVVDIMLDDGTAQLHVGFALDATNHYQLTRCDAVRCEQVGP